MMYEVTVRNHWGEKIVRRVEVDDEKTSLSEIIECGLRSRRSQSLANNFFEKHGRRSLMYYWFPEQIPAPPPAPPRPEPVGFDTLVNGSSV